MSGLTHPSRRDPFQPTWSLLLALPQSTARAKLRVGHRVLFSFAAFLSEENRVLSAQGLARVGDGSGGGLHHPKSEGASAKDP